jgi:hypothetical protein
MLQDAGAVLVGGEQLLDPLPQEDITATGRFEKCLALGAGRLRKSSGEQRFFIHRANLSKGRSECV